MKNDRKAAYLYLTRLSALLRTSLRESSSMLKPVSEELDFVRNYCELQKLRFGERFNYSIFIGEDVNLNKELPKMTIQTFVENAIKHGFENRKDGGIIEIIITHDGDYHTIVLRDNGIGRAESGKIRSDGSGYGIKTVYRVIDIMNKNNHMKTSLEIRDLMDDGVSSGTEVVIRIPDNYSFRTEGLFSSMEDFQEGT
jgi:sensor histidine kinase YesM